MKKKIIAIVGVFISLIIISVTIIKLLPIDFEAGGCAGGYVTTVFDNYNKELVEKYYENSDEKDLISNIKALRGTQEAEWNNQTIFLQFDIEYSHKERGMIKERLHFVGKRVWFETYKWTVGPIIEG